MGRTVYFGVDDDGLGIIVVACPGIPDEHHQEHSWTKYRLSVCCQRAQDSDNAKSNCQLPVNSTLSLPTVADALSVFRKADHNNIVAETQCR